ncbi:Cysteine-rich and transmembrane domain-containing protein 1 [Dictyocoela muelleri]|nr:Cysteine-rich and transmembrane domain-containing protein 1 [Dictyocoela muelleri]
MFFISLIYCLAENGLLFSPFARKYLYSDRSNISLRDKGTVFTLKESKDGVIIEAQKGNLDVDNYELVQSSDEKVFYLLKMPNNFVKIMIGDSCAEVVGDKVLEKNCLEYDKAPGQFFKWLGTVEDLKDVFDKYFPLMKEFLAKNSANLGKLIKGLGKTHVPYRDKIYNKSGDPRYWDDGYNHEESFDSCNSCSDDGVNRKGGLPKGSHENPKGGNPRKGNPKKGNHYGPENRGHPNHVPYKNKVYNLSKDPRYWYDGYDHEESFDSCNSCSDDYNHNGNRPGGRYGHPSNVGYPRNGYPGNGYPGNGYPGNGYPGNEYPGNGYPKNGGKHPGNGYNDDGYRNDNGRFNNSTKPENYNSGNNNFRSVNNNNHGVENSFANLPPQNGLSPENIASMLKNMNAVPIILPMTPNSKDTFDANKCNESNQKPTDRLSENDLKKYKKDNSDEFSKNKILSDEERKELDEKKRKNQEKFERDRQKMLDEEKIREERKIRDEEQKRREKENLEPKTKIPYFSKEFENELTKREPIDLDLKTKHDLFDFDSKIKNDHKNNDNCDPCDAIKAMADVCEKKNSNLKSADIKKSLFNKNTTTDFEITSHKIENGFKSEIEVNDLAFDDLYKKYKNIVSEVFV